MFNAWDPDVFVDLHTTNGSYHGTRSPISLAQLRPGVRWGVRKGFALPGLAPADEDAHGFETFEYGNFLRRAQRRDTIVAKAGIPPIRGLALVRILGIRGRIAILAKPTRMIRSSDESPDLAFTRGFYQWSVRRKRRSEAECARRQPAAWVGAFAGFLRTVSVRSQLQPHP